jgi:hypothetical protein
MAANLERRPARGAPLFPDHWYIQLCSAAANVVRRVGPTFLFIGCFVAIMPAVWGSPTGDYIIEARHGRCDSAPPGGSVEREEVLARLWHARCALEHHRWRDAATSGTLVHGHSLWSELANALPWSSEVVARSLMHAGRPEDAIAVIERAERADERLSQESQARFRYYRALAREQIGADADALATDYSEIVQRWPASAWALRAAIVSPLRVRSAASRLEAGERALSGRNYPLAEALLTAAACGDRQPCSARESVVSGSASQREAAWRLGFLLYRYRREYVDRALVWLGVVMENSNAFSDEALATYARAVQRMDRPSEARRAWGIVLDSDALTPEVREEALLQIGILWLVEGEWAQADSALGEVRRQAESEQTRNSALRWQAWATYRSGDCGRASALWSALASASSRSTDETRYWRAVCQSTAEPEAAQATWRELAAEGPGWYALLSMWRLGTTLDDQGVPVVRRTEPIPGAAFQTVAALAADGAVAEVDWLAPDSLQDDALRVVVGGGQSDWRRWRSRHSGWLSAWPATPNDLIGWRLVYPRFFAGAVERAAAAHGVRAELIWGIMQKESLYNPRAISVSDAMGLMQVVPQTATSIAQERSIFYTDGMLFEPTVAVDYGAWYLAELLQKYDGQYPLAIAAYNAGPVAMDDWVHRFGGLPIDEFVEHIVFDQARNYVKSVFPLMLSYAIGNGDAEVIAGPGFGGLLPDRAIEEPLAGVSF